MSQLTDNFLFNLDLPDLLSLDNWYWPYKLLRSDIIQFNNLLKINQVRSWLTALLSITKCLEVLHQIPVQYYWSVKLYSIINNTEQGRPAVLLFWLYSPLNSGKLRGVNSSILSNFTDWRRTSFLNGNQTTQYDYQNLFDSSFHLTALTLQMFPDFLLEK